MEPIVMSQDSPARADRASAWIAAIHAGLRAYEEIVKAYEGHLARLAEQEITPDVNASLGASGLVQETWLAMWRGFRHFRGTTEAELLAWMNEILRNRLRREQRRVRAARRDVRRNRRLDHQDSQSGSVMAVVDPAPTPGGLAAQKERLERIREATHDLPQDQRLVLLLKCVHGLSDAEIGALLNRTEGAVRVERYRAARRLRGMVEDRDDL
jgi:RNA polymerase sigma-70 factor (ECF subfamily)